MSENKHIQAINDIKDIMERSTRFLSLSGLSGISAGIIAIIGGLFAFFYLDYDMRYFNTDPYFDYNLYRLSIKDIIIIMLAAGVTLILALGCTILFTVIKAKKNKLPIWDSTAKRLLFNLFVPLSAGGLFCMILVYHRIIFLVAPATLLFYGIALFNASKYTVNDIKYLAISEIILGLIAAAIPGYGLAFWTFGFGLLHIIYGTVMYRKYK